MSTGTASQNARDGVQSPRMLLPIVQTVLLFFGPPSPVGLQSTRTVAELRRSTDAVAKIFGLAPFARHQRATGKETAAIDETRTVQVGGAKIKLNPIQPAERMIDDGWIRSLLRGASSAVVLPAILEDMTKEEQLTAAVATRKKVQQLLQDATEANARLRVELEQLYEQNGKLRMVVLEQRAAKAASEAADAPALQPGSVPAPTATPPTSPVETRLEEFDDDEAGAKTQAKAEAIAAAEEAKAEEAKAAAAKAAAAAKVEQLAEAKAAAQAARESLSFEAKAEAKAAAEKAAKNAAALEAARVRRDELRATVKAERRAVREAARVDGGRGWGRTASEASEAVRALRLLAKSPLSSSAASERASEELSPVPVSSVEEWRARRRQAATQKEVRERMHAAEAAGKRAARAEAEAAKEMARMIERKERERVRDVTRAMEAKRRLDEQLLETERRALDRAERLAKREAKAAAKAATKAEAAAAKLLGKQLSKAKAPTPVSPRSSPFVEAAKAAAAVEAIPPPSALPATVLPEPPSALPATVLPEPAAETIAPGATASEPSDTASAKEARAAWTAKELIWAAQREQAARTLKLQRAAEAAEDAVEDAVEEAASLERAKRSWAVREAAWAMERERARSAQEALRAEREGLEEAVEEAKAEHAVLLEGESTHEGGLKHVSPAGEAHASVPGKRKRAPVVAHPISDAAAYHAAPEAAATSADEEAVATRS